MKTYMKLRNKPIKIASLCVLCCLCALTVALIPINIFCTNFPEWVTVLLSVLFCGGLVAYLILFQTKLVTKIILPVSFGLIAVLCSFIPFLVPYWNSYVFKGYNGAILNYDEVISYGVAEADLKALKSHLERTHPAFGGGLTDEVKTAYVASLERLKDRDKITVNDLRREIQTVLHHIGDAHTTTYNNYPDDGYLKAIPQKYSQGYDITAINGKKVKQIFEDAKPYYCYETEDWINIDLGSLATLGFLGYSEPFTYEWSDGDSVIRETYTADDFVSWKEFAEIRNGFVVSDDTKLDFVYYEIDEKKSLATLTLTECNYNQVYIDCVRSMFGEVKEKNIENVAVDLRGNGGGSSLVANEFIKYLPIESYCDGPYDWRWGFLNFHSNGKMTNRRYKDLTFGGGVYILTDNGSFSSAKDFAMLIQDNRLGKVVGEPSANSVNGYGEVAYFYLPNTGLFMQISTKKWYRIDKDNADEYVMPDYPCDGERAKERLYEIIGK